MRYVCLVHGEEQHLRALSRDDMAALDASSLAYDRSLAKSGHLIIAQALQSVKTSKTVRRRSGRKLVTDGPFAETKEQLLGFVMIEAETLDEALDIAARIPLAEIGSIEVRAIYDVPKIVRKDLAGQQTLPGERLRPAPWRMSGPRVSVLVKEWIASMFDRP